MKIMFCLGGLEKGGAERVVCNLVNYMSLKKNDVYLILTKIVNVEYDIDKNVKIIELDERKHNNVILRNIQLINKLKKSIYEINPDVIISFLQEPTFRTLLLKKMNRKIKKIPTIVSLRLDPRHSFNGIRGKLLLKLYPVSNGFVFQTEEARRFFSDKIQSKSTVISNPLNPSFFDEYYKGKRENRIVSVGRLETQKNYPLLLKSFELFHKQNNQYHLYIYGDGSLKDELKEKAKSYKISDFVHFEGKVKNIKEKIYKSSLFILSSDYEGLSNALMEAMALGLPCISTNSSGGGAASLIENNYNGILVPVNDEKALVEAMKRVINDDSLSKKISLNAWKSMKKYSSENINELWLEYIKKIAEGE